MEGPHYLCRRTVIVEHGDEVSEGVLSEVTVGLLAISFAPSELILSFSTASPIDDVIFIQKLHQRTARLAHEPAR